MCIEGMYKTLNKLPQADVKQSPRTENASCMRCWKDRERLSVNKELALLLKSKKQTKIYIKHTQTPYGGREREKGEGSELGCGKLSKRASVRNRRKERKKKQAWQRGGGEVNISLSHRQLPKYSLQYLHLLGPWPSRAAFSGISGCIR